MRCNPGETRLGRCAKTSAPDRRHPVLFEDGPDTSRSISRNIRVVKNTKLQKWQRRNTEIEFARVGLPRKKRIRFGRRRHLDVDRRSKKRNSLKRNGGVVLYSVHTPSYCLSPSFSLFFSWRCLSFCYLFLDACDCVVFRSSTPCARLFMGRLPRPKLLTYEWRLGLGEHEREGRLLKYNAGMDPGCNNVSGRSLLRPAIGN